jgi:hypothetical protein
MFSYGEHRAEDYERPSDRARAVVTEVKQRDSESGPLRDGTSVFPYVLNNLQSILLERVRGSPGVEIRWDEEAITSKPLREGPMK